MNKSESIKEISIALNKFQMEVSNPKNTEANSFFKSKYAPLDVIINTVKPTLTKHGLSVFQNVSGDGEKVNVSTMLTHISGEWIESDILTLSNQVNKGVSMAQAAGISITYVRRYQLSAMLGVSSEDDTDGNNHYQQNNNKEDKMPVDLKSDTQANTKSKGGISDKQVTRAIAIGASKGVTVEQIKKGIVRDYKKTEIADLTKSEYDELCTKLENAAKGA